MNRKNTITGMWRIISVLVFVSVLSVLSGSDNLRAQEASPFVADTTVATVLSSGWEGDDFTAIVLLSGAGDRYVSGKWKFSIKQPFPHQVTGIDDSYIQTAMGMLLMQMEPAIAMAWLLKAAMADEMDAIMFLGISYAINDQVKNKAEAERWFRKAIELGNADAESKLDALLAGNTVSSSVSVKHAYNFNFASVKDK